MVFVAAVSKLYTWLIIGAVAVTVVAARKLYINAEALGPESFLPKSQLDPPKRPLPNPKEDANAPLPKLK